MDNSASAQEHYDIAAKARNSRIVMARKEINTFVEFVIKDEFTKEPVVQAQCHEDWHDACEEHDRVLLYAHRESGKTTQMAVARSLFELGKNPDLRIAIISSSFRQAEKPLRQITEYIERSEELHMVFPHLIPGEPWTTSAITVKSGHIKRDPSVQAIGVNGQVLGARIDLAILDDILSYENTKNARSRQELFDWYHATIVGTLTRHARVIIIGTAWHPDDMLHRFEKNKAVWHTIRFPLLDDNDNVLWPEAWPRDRIESKRAEFASGSEFARQMLCKARDDSESRFKKEWIDECLNNGYRSKVAHSASEFYEAHPQFAPPGWLDEVEDEAEKTDLEKTISSLVEGAHGGFLTGVDLGVKQHAGADESVIFTIFLQPKGRRQVVEVLAGRWTGPEIVSRIIDAHERFGSIVCVENNAAQHFILQFALEIGGVIPIVPFTTGKNKADPLFGIESLATEFSNMQWVIPGNGVNAECPEIDKWIEEMLYYDPNAHTGDRLMASWFARELARRVNKKHNRIGVRSVG